MTTMICRLPKERKLGREQMSSFALQPINLVWKGAPPLSSKPLNNHKKTKHQSLRTIYVNIKFSAFALLVCLGKQREDAAVPFLDVRDDDGHDQHVRAQQSHLFQRHWWAGPGGGHLQGPMRKRLSVGFLARKVPSQELNRSKIFLKTVPTSHKVDQLRWLSLSLSLSGASWKQGEVVIQCASCSDFYGKPKRSLGNTLPWRKKTFHNSLYK